jgi:DNA-binding NarL/FixJ family response regulator
MAHVAAFTDEPVLANGLADVIKEEAGLTLVSVFDTLSGIISKLEVLKPDVLLIDLTPEVTFGVLTELRHAIPECSIVLWVRSISKELAYQAMEIGVRGILRKTSPQDIMIKCLQKVAEGDLWFEKTLTASFLGSKAVTLTKRERQLVNLLAQGLKNKEIASMLFISEGTVKVYLSRLFHKVGVKDRFELALYGLKNLENPSLRQPLWEDRSAAGNLVPQEQNLRSLVLERAPERKTTNTVVMKPRVLVS